VTNAKPSAPVVGFNHNVKYGERVYHVQTEDSGLPHAHYITHLFVGGNIIASLKTSYAEKAEEPDLAKSVRSLMEAQHKLMLKRLVSGEFQEQAARFSAQHYEPGFLADGTDTASYVNTPSSPRSNPNLAKVAPAAPKTPPPAPAAAAPKPLEPLSRRPPPQLAPLPRPVPSPPPPVQVVTPAPHVGRCRQRSPSRPRAWRRSCRSTRRLLLRSRSRRSSATDRWKCRTKIYPPSLPRSSSARRASTK
jgi:hypothetical protein